MKSFKQLMEEIRWDRYTIEKINESMKPLKDQSHIDHQEKLEKNPHSALHEIETVAHLNALHDANHEDKSSPAEHHYPKNSREILNILRERVSKNISGRKPTVEEVIARARNDAQILKEKFPNHTEIHWTPHNTARKEHHSGVSHSGDIVLKHTGSDKDKRGDLPDAAVDLKYGKGTSISPPTHKKVMSGLKPIKKVSALINAFYNRMQTKPPSTSEGRGLGFDIIARNQHNSFQNLGNNEKRSFLKSIWGGSSDSSKVKAYRLPKGGKIEDVDSSFEEKFPPGSKITAERPEGKKRPLRGMRILNNGTHVMTLGIKHYSYKKFLEGKSEKAPLNYNIKLTGN